MLKIYILKARYKNVIITVSGYSVEEVDYAMWGAAKREGCKFTGCYDCSDEQIHMIEYKVIENKRLSK